MERERKKRKKKKNMGEEYDGRPKGCSCIPQDYRCIYQSNNHFSICRGCQVPMVVRIIQRFLNHALRQKAKEMLWK